MKQSEIIEDRANKEENDIKAWGLYSKANRARRMESFLESFLPKLRDKTEVIERKNGSFTLESKTLGILDFYPKSNKILIRSENKWCTSGVDFLSKHVIKS